MLYALMMVAAVSEPKPVMVDHPTPVRPAWVYAVCEGRRPACTIVETKDRVCFSQDTKDDVVLIHCYPKLKDYS